MGSVVLEPSELPPKDCANVSMSARTQGLPPVAELPAPPGSSTYTYGLSITSESSLPSSSMLIVPCVPPSLSDPVPCSEKLCPPKRVLLVSANR